MGRDFGGQLSELQSAAGDIYQKVTAWAKNADDDQLRMMLPRMSFTLTKLGNLKKDMEDEAAHSDELRGKVLEQQIAAVEITLKQLSELNESVTHSLEVIDVSDKEVRAYEIIQLCQKFSDAGARM